MKAWVVRDKNEFCATVVFAETRGKAKSIAMHTDCCESTDFRDIVACRAKKADKYYTEGKRELDWLNAKDRLILVKEFGFYCEDAYLDECKKCSAKEYCDKYEEMMEELNDD